MKTELSLTVASVTNFTTAGMELRLKNFAQKDYFSVTAFPLEQTSRDLESATLRSMSTAPTELKCVRFFILNSAVT